ncbi:MFS transporter [Fictibacillus enclensis]|uniref:MFS transporter n=1 Tax=Fictibacillus enclensis TaxID=1017270 RepID=UPI0025A2B866|nr:MFS transporter [Fictibacillus enclensis]MDM5336198.1 MFS transporter [Fictibacillus enclensis]
MDTNKSSGRKSLFIVVSFLLWFPQFLYVPVFAPYMESLGGKYTFIGIILSSYGITQLLLRMPIGIFSDVKKVRKPFVIFGMVASMLSCLIFLVTDHLGWILVARALAGVAAATWVAFTVLYPRYFADHEVHRAMGSISFVVVLAQFLGMGFSGYIVSEWGWKAPFWIAVCFSIIGVILSFFIFEQKAGIEREPLKVKELARVVKEPSLLKVAILSILTHSIIFSTMFGFTSNYALHIGFHTSELTFIVLAFMIPHAVATLFMGKVLVPLLGEWKALKVAYLLTTVFTILIPLVQTRGLFLMVQVFSGFSLGLIFPLLLGMSIQNIVPEKRATAMGAYQALYAIGIFAGPFFAGIFNSLLGIQAGFYFVGVLGAVATFLVTFWGRGRNTSVVKNHVEKPVQQLKQQP